MPKLDPYEYGETETRCPQCLHVLTDDEAVCYPNEFKCPYCDYRGKTIYEYTIPFKFLEEMDKELLSRLEGDMEWYLEIKEEIDRLVEKWESKTPSTLLGLANSLRLYRERQKKMQRMSPLFP